MADPARPAGLSSAEVTLLRTRNGPREPSPVARFLGVLCGPPALMLVLSGLFDLLGWRQTGSGLLTLAAAMLLAGWSAGVAAHALTAPVRSATAMRDGRAQPVAVGELVCGDVLVLAPGDILSADLSIVDDQGLVLDGGPVAGAVVLAGSGLGRVRALPVGPTLVDPVPAPLRLLAVAAALTAVLLTALLSLRAPGEWPHWLVLGAVLLAAVCVIRPATVTALARTAAARRMAAAGAVVRDPLAVDALARLSVLCLDEGRTGLPKLSAVIPAPGHELAGLWLAVLRVVGAEEEGTVEHAVLRTAVGAVQQRLPPVGRFRYRRQAAYGRAAAHRLGPATVVTVLGDPESLLPHCAPDERFALAVAELTAGAHRVLVLAQSTVDIGGDRPPPGLEVVGLLGFTDATRPAWPLAELRRSGVRVVPVREAGTAVGLVAAHRAAGEVVAVASDRLTFARALLTADLGIAADSRAATLLVPGPGALLAAIRHSRRAARNRHAALTYLAAAGLALLLTVLGATLLLPAPPLYPVHLVWLALAAGVLPVTALAVDHPPGDPLSLPPQRFRLLPALPDAVLLAALSLLCATIGDPAEARTRLLLSLLAGQLALALVRRSERLPLESGWTSARRTPLLLAGSLAVSLVLTAVPVLRTAVGLTWIGLDGLALVVLAGLLALTLRRPCASARPGCPAWPAGWTPPRRPSRAGRRRRR
ncbi:cation transporting ATPase C-terminal domain-containing protein [Crossiella sp. CA198]|uniref:cation transporting ATPase C-terminal domain-containing protein n=1 Tax=Crossiella sp. CA198 TaxID=3455607 RepID=UPI003F8D8A6F